MNRRRLFVYAALVLGGFVSFRVYQELSRAEAGGPGEGFGGPGGGGMTANFVEVAIPERVPLMDRVSLVGSLRAKQRVEVTPRVSGRVMEMRVDRGDRVRAGQVVARLEDDELRQQVRRAEAASQVAWASVAQRQAELKSLEMELERFENLSQDGVVSSQQLDQARTRVEVIRAQAALAQAQVAQAEAELEELRIRLSQSEVLAPLTGIVATRFVDVGALVSSSTPILLILDLSTMMTVVNVPERDVTKIEVGNRARVMIDAVAGQEFVARVVRISPILDPQTRTAPVELELENAGEQLKAEMFARVDLNLTTEREALLVPRDALVYRNDRQGVFVLDSETVRFQPVTTGLTEGDRVEVTTGLTEQHTVVTRGANLLQNGDAVQVLHPEGD